MKRLQIAVGQSRVHLETTLPLIGLILESTSDGRTQPIELHSLKSLRQGYGSFNSGAAARSHRSPIRRLPSGLVVSSRS